MNHGIIIHPEDFNDLLGMSAEEAGHIIQNVIKTFNGESVVPFADRYLTRVSNDMCGRVLRDKELSEKRSRVGKLGGGQFGNSNAKRAKTSKNEQTTSNERAKTNSNTNTKTNTKTNINKKPYGEFENVFLTEDEFQKIKDKGLESLINELSFYISSKGVKYKSHYATIISWGNRRKVESKPKENSFTQGARVRDYHFEEILQRKQVN